MSAVFDYSNWRIRNQSYGSALALALLTLALLSGAGLARSHALKLLLSIGSASTSAIALGVFRSDYLKFSRMSNIQDNAHTQGWSAEQIKVFDPNDAKIESNLIDSQEDLELDPFTQKMLHTAQTGDRNAIVICRALSEYGLNTALAGTQEGFSFKRYYLEPGEKVSVKAVQARSLDLQLALALESEPPIIATNKGIAIDLPLTESKVAKYEQFASQVSSPVLGFPLGVDQLTSELLWIDFTDPNQPHALVGGTTGSGKSQLLRCAARFLSENYTSDQVHLLMIDPKRSTFGSFKNSPNSTLILDPVQGAIALVKLVQKMQDRRIQRGNAIDIAEYNSVAVKPMPRIVLLVEEMAELLQAMRSLSDSELETLSLDISSIWGSKVKIAHSGKGTRSPYSVVLDSLIRLGQAGRSEGIHIVVCSQEPDKKLLQDLAGNLPVKVLLKVRSRIESDVIIPNQNAYGHNLMGRGDMLIYRPSFPMVRAQGLFY